MTVCFAFSFSKSVKGVKEEVFVSTKFSDLPLHPHLVSVELHCSKLYNA